jgi:hypothetical protein
VYTQRVQEQQVVSQRPAQIITGTGAPGVDATAVIPGPSGRDGILKETDPKTAETLRTMLVQHWNQQRDFQRYLITISIFAACVLAGNTYVLWTDDMISPLVGIVILVVVILWSAFLWFFLTQEKENMRSFTSIYESDTPEQKEYFNDILDGLDYYKLLDIPADAPPDFNFKDAYHPDKAPAACAAVRGETIRRIRRDNEGRCFLTLDKKVREIFPKPNEQIMVFNMRIAETGIVGQPQELNNSKGTPLVYTDDPYTFEFEPETKVLNKPLDTSAVGTEQVVSRADCVTRANSSFNRLVRAKEVLQDPQKRAVYDKVRERFHIQ